jgi:hypothetical protein
MVEVISGTSSSEIQAAYSDRNSPQKIHIAAR